MTDDGDDEDADSSIDPAPDSPDQRDDDRDHDDDRDSPSDDEPRPDSDRPPRGDARPSDGEFHERQPDDGEFHERQPPLGRDSERATPSRSETPTRPESSVDNDREFEPDQTESPIERATETDDGVALFLKDVLSSVGTVVLVALLLFAISGIWPPLVAVQSGSMEPHMYRGDLVFLMDEHRFPPDSAIAGTGVVTYRKGQETGYWSFGNYGNVVVYRPDGGDGTPIIHRARFYVEEGDDWVAMANDAYLGGVDTCAETMTCPAPHDGFITKGDNNGEYDQVGGQSTVVEPSWVTGRAKVRIPWLGYVRLWFGSSAPLGSATAPTGIAGVIGAIVTRLELAIAALAGIQVARTIG